MLRENVLVCLGARTKCETSFVMFCRLNWFLVDCKFRCTSSSFPPSLSLARSLGSVLVEDCRHRDNDRDRQSEGSKTLMAKTKPSQVRYCEWWWCCFRCNRIESKRFPCVDDVRNRHLQTCAEPRNFASFARHNNTQSNTKHYMLNILFNAKNPSKRMVCCFFLLYCCCCCTVVLFSFCSSCVMACFSIRRKKERARAHTQQMCVVIIRERERTNITTHLISATGFSTDELF